MLAHCYPRPVAKKHRPVVCKVFFVLFILQGVYAYFANNAE